MKEADWIKEIKQTVFRVHLKVDLYWYGHDSPERHELADYVKAKILEGDYDSDESSLCKADLERLPEHELSKVPVNLPRQCFATVQDLLEEDS
jgi:hypothetical protein